MDEDLLSQALKLIEIGKEGDGGRLLARLVQEQPRNERAWLWLHVCVKEREQKIYCLQRALEINPTRIEAREELEKLLVSTPNFIEPNGESTKTARFKASQPEKLSENRDDKYFEKFDTEKQSHPGKKKRKSGTRNTKKGHGNKKHVEKPKVDSSPIEDEQKTELAERNGEELSEPEFENQTVEEKERKEKSKPKEIIIPYKEPKVIIVHPEENTYNLEGINLLSGITGLFGKSLLVDGVRITPYDFPLCIKIGRIPDINRCELCDFFTPNECPIIKDPYLLDEARFFFSSRIEQKELEERRRKYSLNAIYKELKEHGRPLHYSVIARIIANRYPKLKLSQRSVFKFMARHPEKFEYLGEGVYQCRQT